MSVRARQVNPQGTRVFMGTVTDGLNLHDALAQTAHAHQVKIATFEMLGGLKLVEFTAYDADAQTRLEPIIVERALEIVAGHGTISQLDGNSHVHMHLAVSFLDETSSHGITVLGGHVARALAYAVEFTLTAYDGISVQRGHHVGTGLHLWDLPELPK